GRGGGGVRPAPVGGDGVRGVDLPVVRAEAPPGGEEGAARVELLDAGVVARIRDIDVPAPVGRHAEGEVELSIARAEAPPGGEEGAGRIELLDAVVVLVRDVDVAAPVGRHADGVVEFAAPRARLDAPLQEERAAGWHGRGGRAQGADRFLSGARGRLS